MALTKTTRVERVLIVLDMDGSLKGAHAESLTTISDGDIVLAVTQEPAAPLTAQALAGVLPDRAALLAQVQALTVERDAALASRAQAEQERDQLAAQVAAVQGAGASVDGVPVAVTRLQAKMALYSAGLLDDADAIIAQADGVTTLFWREAATFERSHPLIASLGAQLGLTSEDIDALFVAAAQL